MFYSPTQPVEASSEIVKVVPQILQASNGWHCELNGQRFSKLIENTQRNLQGKWVRMLSFLPCFIKHTSEKVLKNKPLLFFFSSKTILHVTCVLVKCCWLMSWIPKGKRVYSELAPFFEQLTFEHHLGLGHFCHKNPYEDFILSPGDRLLVQQYWPLLG